MLFRLCLSIALLGGLLCSLGIAVNTPPAYAADFTGLLDAADDFDDNDPTTYKAFDFHIEPSLRLDFGNATIAREAPCVPGDDPSLEDELVSRNARLIRSTARCSEPGVVYNKEMDYRETRTSVDLTLRAGIYKDFEFRLTVPYVFHSSRSLKYANEDARADQRVDAQNSSVDPSQERIRRDAHRFDPDDSYQQTLAKLDHFSTFRYFELGDDYSTYERSGFADPSIGLHWAPFNDERDPTKATLLFGVDYVMPIAPIERADNQAVGRGMHELQWKLAASKSFDWIEPYFGLQYFLPIPSSRSPIGQVDPNNIGQVFINPPHRGIFTLGTEFVPYQDAPTGQRYAIDLRFQFGYTSEGRDYSPLSDHFANSQCSGKTIDDVLPQFDDNGQLLNPDDVACAWIVRQPSNADPTPIYDLQQAQNNPSPFSHDGIMTVESYATYAGTLGLYLQPASRFQLKAVVNLMHKQNHFLTNARTGRAQVEGDTVALTGPRASIERNPVYNPYYDSPGNRFRVEGYTVWSFLVTTALQF